MQQRTDLLKCGLAPYLPGPLIFDPSGQISPARVSADRDGVLHGGEGLDDVLLLLVELRALLRADFGRLVQPQPLHRIHMARFGKILAIFLNMFKNVGSFSAGLQKCC